MGEYGQALPYNRRALSIREGLFGPDHLSLADDLVDIGRALSGLDRFAEALSFHERALHIVEAALASIVQAL
jgi:hypothetical protein